MAVSTAAGAKFYIGTAAANGVTDTYTEINPIVSISEFGRVYTEIKFSPLSTRGTQKFKGSYDDGGCDLSLGRDVGDPGQILLRAALNLDSDFNFKYQPNDAVAALSAVVTMSIAAPGIVTDTLHGLLVNTPVSFSTTGALPTGLTPGTTYYVKTVVDANSYSLALTAGGSAITTSGTQSGVHTRSTVPAPSYQLMKGKVLSYTNNNGTLDSVIAAMAKISITSGSIVETPKIPLS